MIKTWWDNNKWSVSIYGCFHHSIKNDIKYWDFPSYRIEVRRYCKSYRHKIIYIWCKIRWNKDLWYPSSVQKVHRGACVHEWVTGTEAEGTVPQGVTDRERVQGSWRRHTNISRISELIKVKSVFTPVCATGAMCRETEPRAAHVCVSGAVSPVNTLRFQHHYIIQELLRLSDHLEASVQPDSTQPEFKHKDELWSIPRK